MRIYDKEQFNKENIFGLGNANAAYAQYFIGNSYLNPLTEAGKCPVFLANVTFEAGMPQQLAYPSCEIRRRTASHLHGRRGVVSGRG